MPQLFSLPGMSTNTACCVHSIDCTVQCEVLHLLLSMLFYSPSLLACALQSHAAMKASLYEVEVLTQTAKSLRSANNIAHEVAVLRQAFGWLQNTKKVRGCISFIG